MPSGNDQEIAEKDLLTTAELAELCGVSIHTIRSWRQRGSAPNAVLYGKSLRFPRPGVDAWLARGGNHPRPLITGSIR